RRGAWGPFRGPISVSPHRGAPRLRRGATNVGGLGGHFGAPSPSRHTEARHGSAGARRTSGGLGAISGAPSPSRHTEARHGSAGARRTSGGLGAISGPPSQ